MLATNYYIGGPEFILTDCHYNDDRFDHLGKSDGNRHP